MENNPKTPSSDSGQYRSNPITVFQKTIADVVEDPENFDISTVFGKTLNYVRYVIGPQRWNETSEAYKVRVFADLLERSKNYNGSRSGRQSTECDHRRDLVLRAKEAAESGHPEKARRLYLRLILITDSVDPVYWLLYGAFCAREGDHSASLVCARRAVALDGRDRIAMFAQAALLMTATDVDGQDELETVLRSLSSAHPRFAEGHFLAAVHYCQTDLRDAADRSFSLAGSAAAGVDEGYDDGAADAVLRIGVTTVWEPVAGAGDADPALKCAVLLCLLELDGLGAMCLRCFASTRSDPYHYMMAVTHYRRSEYRASADHLNSMASRRSAADGGWTLLAAHVDYGAGRVQEAMVRYVGLLLAPHQDRYGLAYSRVAGHFAATRRYAEAADAYRRAYTAIPVPALMTKLAACLVALGRYVEAERLLVSVVAADGAYDGDAWRQLATGYAATGCVEMADVCRRRAAELGYDSDLFGKR